MVWIDVAEQYHAERMIWRRGGDYRPIDHNQHNRRHDGIESVGGVMACKLTPEQLAEKYPNYRMPRRVRDPNKPRMSIADLAASRKKPR